MKPTINQCIAAVIAVILIYCLSKTGLDPATAQVYRDSLVVIFAYLFGSSVGSHMKDAQNNKPKTLPDKPVFTEVPPLPGPAEQEV